MSDTEHHHEHTRRLRDFSGVVHWLKGLLNRKPESEDEEESLRGALEEYIDVLSAQQQPEDEETAASQERTLLSNVLDLRHTIVANIMVPRADIVALDVATPPDQFLAVLVDKHHSRVPLYRESLDDIVGIVHIKDVLAVLAQGKTLVVEDLIREAPVVSPSLPVMEALVMMRETRQHLLFVIDEYGGIDGLVTIGDVVAAIIGEVQDEYEQDEFPAMQDEPDGSVLADARTPISDFEEKFGNVFSDGERDMADTLGGFVFTIAGCVPSNGEFIRHEESGLVFEVLESTSHRIERLRIHPTQASESKAAE